MKLTVESSDVTAAKVWESKELDNHHGGVILVDGYPYGASLRDGTDATGAVSGQLAGA